MQKIYRKPDELKRVICFPHVLIFPNVWNTAQIKKPAYREEPTKIRVVKFLFYAIAAIGFTNLKGVLYYEMAITFFRKYSCGIALVWFPAVS